MVPPAGPRILVDGGLILLGILGVTAVADPLARGGIGWLDLGVMVALPLALLPLLRTQMRLSGLDGVVLLASFAFYMVWLVVSSGAS